jgi:hypothetical protein
MDTFPLLVILMLSVFNMAAAVIGYMCLKSAGKEKENNAKFLIFNMVVSGLLILLSGYGIYSSTGGRNSPVVTSLMNNLRE